MAAEFKGVTVVHLQRRPQEAQFSLERLYEAIRGALPSDVHCHVCIAPCASRGLWKRIVNIIAAAVRQGQVNHVTGDVHYLALMLRKRRTLLTIHDCRSLHRLNGWRRELVRFLWYILPMRRVALVSVVSEATKADLLQNVAYPRERIRVVYNCVTGNVEPIVRAFNSEKPRILQIGTGDNKNLLRVVGALGNLSCHLRIVGKLTAEQLEALAIAGIEYSSVFDLSDGEMRREYADCDLVVFASTYEGFGLPIVEANAIGRAVVTSNVAPMTEVGIDAVCYVDPCSVTSIREGIRRVVEDDAFRDRLIANGFANARRFHPAAIASEYAAIYRELAAG